MVTSAIQAKAQSQIKINKDEKSPYAGVLITEESYRSMWIDIKQSDSLKSELQVCLDNEMHAVEVDKTTLVGAGFLLGILSAVAVAYSFK